MSQIKSLIVGLSLFVFLITNTYAQDPLTQEVAQMQQNAQVSLDQGDFANSIMLLNQAIRLAPRDVSLRRDLSYTYFLSGKAKKAQEVLTPVLSSDFADELTFQLGSAIESSLDNYRKAKRILTNGLKKYPHSGILYNSQGNLFSKSKSDKSAIASWQKGIEMDPSYPLNYYNAAKFYYNKDNAVWAILYAEIYLNLEQNPARISEMKKLLVDGYQLLFLPGKNEKLPEFNKEKPKNQTNDFQNAFRQTYLENASIIRNGINTETLTMLRTRFILSWQRNYSNTYPFTLLTFQEKLLKEGYFDAYNQWLFGAYTNSQAYSAWIQKHNKLFSSFEQWRKTNFLQPASFDPKP